MPVVPVWQLLLGKTIAAFDRQHPRDLLDVKIYATKGSLHARNQRGPFTLPALQRQSHQLSDYPQLSGSAIGTFKSVPGHDRRSVWLNRI